MPYGVSSAPRKTLVAPPCTRRRPPLRSERLKVTPHGHLGAVQCGGQLPDQDRTALTEGLS